MCGIAVHYMKCSQLKKTVYVFGGVLGLMVIEDRGEGVLGQQITPIHLQ